eukprot:14428691-Alexandrium_andersonii.AAC.1
MSLQYNNLFFAVGGKPLEPFRGGYCPPDPPRLAPPARAASPGGLRTPGPPSYWCLLRTRGASRGVQGGHHPPGEATRAGGASRAGPGGR